MGAGCPKNIKKGVPWGVSLGGPGGVILGVRGGSKMVILGVPKGGGWVATQPPQKGRGPKRGPGGVNSGGPKMTLFGGPRGGWGGHFGGPGGVQKVTFWGPQRVQKGVPKGSKMTPLRDPFFDVFGDPQGTPGVGDQDLQTVSALTICFV